MCALLGGEEKGEGEEAWARKEGEGREEKEEVLIGEG